MTALEENCEEDATCEDENPKTRYAYHGAARKGPMMEPTSSTVGFGTFESGTWEIGTLEIRSLEIRSLESGTLESGALESGTLESGTLESGTLETGTAVVSAKRSGGSTAARRVTCRSEPWRLPRWEHETRDESRDGWQLQVEAPPTVGKGGKLRKLAEAFGGHPLTSLTPPCVVGGGLLQIESAADVHGEGSEAWAEPRAHWAWERNEPALQLSTPGLEPRVPRVGADGEREKTGGVYRVYISKALSWG